MTPKEQHTLFIKKTALELGFIQCGISKARKLDEDARRLEHFLNEGHQGNMKYLENHFELRIDPRLLVPGARSVISLMYNYFPEKQQQEGLPKISKYAYGEDYHDVIRDKLKALMQRIREEIGEVQGRVFVDSAPVLEKSWAALSGLGWIGKHTNLINKQLGSFFFLAELIIDLELEYDAPIKDYCGTCTRCIDACPTEAILPNKTLNASRCISYLTIELREEIPEEFHGKSEGWLFGCDICQDVCPWNRFSKPHYESRFVMNEMLINRTESEWRDISEEVFKTLYKNSPLRRAGFKGLQKNLRFIKNKEAE